LSNIADSTRSKHKDHSSLQKENVVVPKDSQTKANDKTTFEGFRYLMRSIVRPVALVVTNTSKTEQHESAGYAHYRGATISSLTSVTITPHPTISFNLKTKGLTAQEIINGQIFSIYILANNSTSVDLANEFSQDHFERPHAPFESAEKAGNFIAVDEMYKFHGPSILAHMTCRVIKDKLIDVGDQKVFVARVERIEQQHVDSNVSDVKMSLMHVNRTYRTVGSVIESLQLSKQKGHGQDSHSKGRRSFSTSSQHRGLTQSIMKLSDDHPEFNTQTLQTYMTLTPPLNGQSFHLTDEKNERPRTNSRFALSLIIAELQSFGPEKIRLAIDAGRRGAPLGIASGCVGNHDGRRIRKLVVKLHRANRAGHVDDKTVEELLLDQGSWLTDVNDHGRGGLWDDTWNNDDAREETRGKGWKAPERGYR